MRWRGTVGGGATSLIVALSACGQPAASGSPSPSASATASVTPTEPSPTPSSILPSFDTAQEAAIYGVQEWNIIGAANSGDQTPIYQTGSCTPTAQQPCLTGGTMTMGDHAAYGEFALTARAAGAACYAYVFQDASGWHNMQGVCVQNNVVPIRGQEDTVISRGSTCANVRQAPGLNGKVVACLPDGTTVQVDDGPNYVANGAGQLGFLWWHLAGKGWMAHQSLSALWSLPPNTPCPEPRCTLQPATCPAAYTASARLTGAGSFHSTVAYDNIALPPLTTEQGNGAAGFLGTMLCSGGALAEIQAFMQTELIAHRFHFTPGTACALGSYSSYECWNTGPNNKYDFVLGFNSPTDWFAGFHNPDNFG